MHTLISNFNLRDSVRYVNVDSLVTLKFIDS